MRVIIVWGKDLNEKAEAGTNEVNEILNSEKVASEVEIIQGLDPAKILETTAKRDNFDIITIGRRGLRKNGFDVSWQLFKTRRSKCTV